MPPVRTSRADCLALDRADPLAALRDEFVLPEKVVYLDGNSLGALPKRAIARVDAALRGEWGEGLIRSWNDAGWIELGGHVAARIAALIGAGAENVSVGDSTSVNLYKVLYAALALQRGDGARRVIVTERGNFPTDLYIAGSVAAPLGLRVEPTAPAELAGRLGADCAVLLLTHVHYRSGRVHDMAALTRAAHAAGVLVVWDLAHSAGALPVDLLGCAADFAVGCGYKYLNGGPGAPAFLFGHPRHLERMQAEAIAQPLSGWLGHAAPFAFASAYQPAPGIARFQCGTPPILSLTALDAALEVFAAAEAHGGMAALRTKSLALTSLFIELVEARCRDTLQLVTPRQDSLRGSQVSFAHAHGQAVMTALIERGVIGDFRRGDASAGNDDPSLAGDLLRFGFTPLYTRYVDAWDAAEALADILASESWRAARFASEKAVT